MFFLYNFFIDAYTRFFRGQQKLEFYTVLTCLRSKGSEGIVKDSHKEDVRAARPQPEQEQVCKPVIFSEGFDDKYDTHVESTKNGVNIKMERFGIIQHKMAFAAYHVFLKDVLTCMQEYGPNPDIPVEEGNKVDEILVDYMG